MACTALVPASGLAAEANVFTLGEVHVVAPADADAPGEAVLTQDDMRLLDRDTLDEALNAMAGVAISQSGNQRNERNYFIRGNDRWRVPLYIDGISGRPNRVWDVGNGRVALGRFGWKANQPSLHQQLAGAMVGDLGITSPLLHTQNCPPAQTACRQAPDGDTPELTAGQLHALTTYHLGLGVPARRDADQPEVTRGEALFAAAGCAACHLPTLATTSHPVIDALGGQVIHPYTDLLLHDMGDGLADGRPDYLASGTEWRTAPLWGLGLRDIVNQPAGLLHDGRARTLLEAILWHGGEGKKAADAVRTMPAEDRAALLRFLDSL